MKRPRVIVAVAVVFYVAVMAFAWVTSTAKAHAKTVAALREARNTFVHIVEDAVDTIMWYSSGMVFDELGETLVSVDGEKMRDIVRRYHLDELNIVASNGLVIASNVDNEIGRNFRDHPVLAEFMDILEPGQPNVSYGQPYRRSVGNPDFFCKYYAVAFPDRSGFVQFGLSLAHIIRTFSRSPARDYEKLRIGLYGYYKGIDLDGDGFTDHARDFPSLPEEGVFGTAHDQVNGRVYTYTFPYVGLVICAVVPEREFHEQRNQVILIGGIAFAVFIAAFTFLFVRLSVSTDRLKAMHAASEVRNAADLSVARVIQLSALPRAELFRPARMDVVFGAATYPAREVGGDFYNMYELADGRIAFLVADVSGKGVPAAMFMHVANNALYTAFHIGDDIGEVLSSLNDYLCRHNEAEMFVTAWVGLIDPAKGEIAYVNAGHNRPFVVRADGTVVRVDGKGGLFLGVFPGTKYRVNRLQLASGDRLFLYTDGVTEAMDANRRVYGEPRLVRRLSERPEDLCAAVKADVDAHVAGAERSDDLTVLSLTWLGEPPRVERAFPVSEADAAVAFLRAEIRLRNGRQASRLLNAADEMISNVVNYSGAAQFTLTVEHAPGRCRVTVSDAGAPYDPMTHVDPDTHLPLKDRPLGGLGILMCKRLVTSVTYRRASGRNVLSLVQVDCDADTRPIS